MPTRRRSFWSAGGTCWPPSTAAGTRKTHRLTVPTSFGPGARLTDYAGAGPPVVTDAQGRATVSIAPGGYSYYAPAGHSLTQPVPKALPTTQTWEFADDLDTGRLSDAPQTVRVMVPKGNAISAKLTVDGGVPAELTVLGPAGKPLGSSSDSVALPSAPVTGVYLLRVRTTNGQKAHGTLTVRY